MEFTLIPHPDHLPKIEIKVRALVERQGTSGLRFQYTAEGQVGLINFGEWSRGGRTDGLWQHSCYEAFVGPAGGTRYLELNFLSRRWAAYLFDDYRAGMRDAPIEPFADSYGEMYATDLQNAAVDLGPLGDSGMAGPLDVALTAIIEETSGHKSYWALAHADGPPDFHNRSCFLAHLPE
jgi:hypothetical protein